MRILPGEECSPMFSADSSVYWKSRALCKLCRHTCHLSLGEVCKPCGSLYLSWVGFHKATREERSPVIC